MQLTNAGASTAASKATADIEDMASGGGDGGAAGRNILRARARVTKRVGKAPSGLLAAGGSPGKENTGGGDGGGANSWGKTGAEEEEEEEIVPIRREDDFQGWLAQQQAGWKRHRERRKVTRREEARSQVRSLGIVLHMLFGHRCCVVLAHSPVLVVVVAVLVSVAMVVCCCWWCFVVADFIDGSGSVDNALPTNTGANASIALGGISCHRAHTPHSNNASYCA